MKNHRQPRTGITILTIVFALVLVALVIDLVDGEHLKTIGTAGLALGLLGLLLCRVRPQVGWRYLAIVGFVVFIAMVAYRAALYQGLIG